MKRRLPLSALIILLLVVLLSTGCAGKLTREQTFALLEDKALAFSSCYTDFFEELNNTDSYFYTVTYYSESLKNFDYADRIMPSSGKMWEKINATYTYIKCADEEYSIETITLPEYDDNNLPVFSDAKYKNPVFAATTVTEIWSSGGTVSAVKVNGVLAADISEYSISPYYASHTPDAPSALFKAERRKWFSKQIMTAQYILANTLNDTSIAYTDCEFAIGYNEDLSFDWAGIAGIDINTFALTAKKGIPHKFEYYSEQISSYQKTSTQIWNNETVTKWYGDRTGATKLIVDFVYPTRKKPLSIPVL